MILSRDEKPVKHRALIVGAGRMGAGYPNRATWSERYLYTHAEAYLALKDRVDLVGFVEPDHARRIYAEETYGRLGYASLSMALEACRPDIVSICTPPEERERVMASLNVFRVAGVWCEKPLSVRLSLCQPTNFDMKVQVNFCRRFDPLHRELAITRVWQDMWVWAKRDMDTVVHFTDLARFFGIQRDGMRYFHMDGPNSYVIRHEDGASFFPLGGIKDGSPFMVNALTNLLDAVEGKATLISAPENAIESERWAREIIANG